MKLIIPLLVGLIPLAGVSQTPINSVKNIKSTIETLSEAFSSKEDFPADFIFTKDEIQKYLTATKRDYDIETFDTQYNKYVDRVQRKFDDVKRSLGKIERVLSWDTTSYKHTRETRMDVSFVFQSIPRYSNKAEKVRVLLEMAIFDNGIFINETLYTISELHYDLHLLRQFNYARESLLQNAYSPNLFHSSDNGVIPFQKNKKWGLITQQGEVKLPAVYDSIAPFSFDYYRVVSKKGYNLYTADFKPRYDKELKYIRMNWSGYFVTNSKGEFVSINQIQEPPKNKEEDISLEEVTVEMPVVEDTRETHTKKQKSLREQLSDEYYVPEPYRIQREDKDVFNNKFTIRSTSNDSVVAVFKGYFYLDPHSIFLAGRDSIGNSIVAAYTGNVLLRSPYVGTYESPGYELLFDKKTRLFGIFCPYTKLLIEPKYHYIKPIDRDRFFLVVTKKGKVGYLDGTGKELF